MESEEKMSTQVLDTHFPNMEMFRQFLSLVENLPHGVILVDTVTLLPVEVNSAACNILGFTRNEIKSIPVRDLNNNFQARIDGLFSQKNSSKIPVCFETMFRTKKGILRNCSTQMFIINIEKKEYVFLFLEDVSEQKISQDITMAERSIFQICYSSVEKKELFHNLLSFFKEFTGCEAIGIRIREGEDFPYVETNGFPDTFVELERSLCAYDRDGKIFRDHNGDPVLECMCGNIISGRFDPSKPFFTKNGSFWSGNTTELLAATSEKDRQSATRNRCNGSGYESVALIPIKHSGTTYGLFQFNDKRRDWHTAEKVEILEHLVNYVGIALAKIESDQALITSEQNFKQIFNSTTEAILIHDAESGRFIDVNETMVRMFGFHSKAEALSKSVSDISYGEEQPTTTRALSLVKKASTEGPQIFEWLCQKMDGKTFWAEVVLNRFMIAGKYRVLSVVRDISERKRIEEALNQSIEHYRLLFEEMIEGFALHEIILDTRGTPVDYRFLDVNPAFETLTGLKKESLIGHTVKEVMPGTEDYWIEKYGNIALHGGDLQYENYAGELGKWFEVTAYCPKFGQFVTVFEDITNKKMGALALKESEEQFRSTFEQTSIGMCIVSVDGIFLRINKAFCHLLGYTEDELLGKSVKTITHPDDYRITEEQLQQPVQTKNQNLLFEKRYISKSGNVIYAAISSTLILDSNGNPRHFVTQIQDISEKKRTEEALQLRDKIFTHSLDMLFIAGFDGYFKVVNPAFETTLGWTKEEMLARPWIDFVHPDDKGKTVEVKAKRLDNGQETLQFENRYLCKDGNYRWLSWNSFPYADEKIIVGVARDVTERKALDESLHRSEERYHLIDEASSDQIYSYDLQSRFTHVNTTLCKTLGLSIDQILGKTHRDLGFPEEQCAEWDALHNEVFSTNKTVFSETIATINNQEHYYEVVLNPMHDSEGKIIGIAGATRDIHARKIAEIKIQDQMDELRRWNAVTLGRENRVIELKQEVNQLLSQMCQPIRYKFDKDTGDKP
jgi:PAS domain S-box-containing protein